MLVVVAHGLNVHWLSPYGNSWVQMPFLEQLASESILFDNHYAEYPDTEGWQSLRRRCFSALPTLVEGAVQESQGIWQESRRLLPPWDYDPDAFSQYAETADGFTEERGNVVDPEPMPVPIDPFQPNHWNDLRFTFAATLEAFDRELQTLFELLRPDETNRPLILTSSFGQALGEHGSTQGQPDYLYEECLHIPLLIRLPGKRGALTRFGELTGSETLPEILQSLNTDPDNFEASLLGLARKRILCRSQGRTTLRLPDCSYLQSRLHPDRPMLFCKPEDIWEVNDIAQQEPGLLEQCEALLEEPKASER